MLLIGLTGGIGSGKSTVCDYFRQLGVPIIDTDIIAHELVQPGRPALEQLVQLFGPQIVLADGSLDRATLRRQVFDNAAERQRLEELLHPLIRQEMGHQLEQLDAEYVIIAIPLLLEKQWQHQLDRVLVVDCSVEQQMDRATNRDGGSRQLISRIIASQVDRQSRLNAADDVLDNSGNLESLQQQISTLHHHYLELAAQE